MRRTKYGSRKTTIDGICFDSQKEARRYKELKLMERAGKIRDLKLQQQFKLIPAQYDTVQGKKKCIERAVSYIADFVYMKYVPDTNSYEMVVEDTKGYKTPEYIIKRKLMLQVYGIKIKEV